MAFCTKEKHLVDGGVTAIDNKFILNYLPDAPDLRSAVYLLGLTLCNSDGSDNCAETIANKLGITVEDVMDAYAYWDELGLVHITADNPCSIVYLDVRGSASALKKVNPSKYSKFSRAIQQIITGRMISVTEYNEYYMFLENTTFEPEALLAVAQYCVDMKGADISYRYILTVCHNQMAKGATTLAVVQDNLNSKQKYDDDLNVIFKKLKLTRKVDYEDRELYDKWTRDMDFTLDVITNVASRVKTGGMTKLDNLLCEYYRKQVQSVCEIDNYEQTKAQLYELAKDINKAIGLYYQSLEAEIDEYITVWLNKGYDGITLTDIAKYCFRSGIRTLQGLNGVIDKLYRNGVTTTVALNQYVNELAERDNKVKLVLNCAGLERNVNSSDRQLYKTWLAWNMPEDVILHVAELSRGTNAPMAYINRVLGDYKQNGIHTLAQAQSHATTTATKQMGHIGGIDIERHEYSDEELRALFTNLDEEDD